MCNRNLVREKDIDVTHDGCNVIEIGLYYYWRFKTFFMFLILIIINLSTFHRLDFQFSRNTIISKKKCPPDNSMSVMCILLVLYIPGFGQFFVLWTTEEVMHFWMSRVENQQISAQRNHTMPGESSTSSVLPKSGTTNTQPHSHGGVRICWSLK